jgi:hypothetical protein
MSSNDSDTDLTGMEVGSKHRRTDGSKKKRDAAASSTPGWMADFKNMWRKEIKKDNDKIVAQLKDVATAVSNNSVRVDNVEQKHDALEQEVCEMGKLLAHHSALLSDGSNSHSETKKIVEKEFAVLEQRLAAAEAAPPPKPNNAFDRDSFPWRLKVSGHGGSRFTKESLTKLVDKLCFEAGLQNPNFEIDGPLHSKWYNVDFGGKGSLGKTMAGQVFESLYNKSTKVRKPTEAAGVASEGEAPSVVQVYFNLDLSPKMERTAMLARKTKSVVEHLHPDKKIFVRRSDFRLSVDFAPVIQPVTEGEDHWDLKFKKGVIFSEAQANEIKKALSAKLEDTAGGGEWV